jgi:hypothetical protein
MIPELLMIHSPACGGSAARTPERIVNSRIAVVLPAIVLLLSACLGNSGSPTAPPTGVQAYAGDGTVSLTWNEDPNVDYWVFFAQDPTLSLSNDWASLFNANAIHDAYSPITICNQINNPQPSANFPALYFTVNGRVGSSPGGAGSPLVSVSPRPSGGGASAPWLPGVSIPAPMSALGYAAITGCGVSGRPAQGLYVAVGPGGAVYSGRLAPNVAGPLSPATGNEPISWIQGNVPPGFSADLHGVASVTTSFNPAAPGVILVAVGTNAAILRSLDGQNWTQVTGVPTNVNLNGIASTGSGFVAIGDVGTVLTSVDGLTWTVSYQASTVSGGNTLNAIHCAGGSCVVAGQRGQVLSSSDGGLSWAQNVVGNNNWIDIAYGNYDINADAIVSAPAGVRTFGTPLINTWVVIDANGNFGYTVPATSSWVTGQTPIAASLVAIDYSTRFIALDRAGNAYASENGASWQLTGSTGLNSPVAIRRNATGALNATGFVALASGGANAASF